MGFAKRSTHPTRCGETADYGFASNPLRGYDTVRQEQDEIRLRSSGNEGMPPLPLERVGVRDEGFSIGLCPLTRFAAQIDLSPQGRGEQRDSTADSLKNHPALAGNDGH